MFQVIQKHRRFVMFFIFLFIGIPLAFMVPGASNSGNRGQYKGDPIMDVNGNQVYAHELLALYNEEVDRRTKQDRPAKAADLFEDGTMDTIIEGLIQRAMLTQKTSQNAVIPNQQYLAEKLKDDPFFQNEDGDFVPTKYNTWVEGNDRGGINWDDFYADFAIGVNQNAFLQLVRASARISESDIRKQYLESQRKMKVRYLTVEPTVELSDEELNAYYAENSDRFNSPAENTIDYVSFSLLPPVPESVIAVLTQARAGDDFAALAKEHSEGADKEAGGDMGWVEVNDTPVGQEVNYVGLAVGEVSEPVRFFSEIYLYKVEEERVNEDTQATEKHVRRIIFRPEVSPEARKAVQTAADDFLALVETHNNDLRKAATEAGLEVFTSPSFHSFSTDIEGVSLNDLRSFSQAFASLPIDTVSKVVSGSEHLFVAKCIDTKEPAPQTLDEVRESVLSQATNDKKRLPEYRALLSSYMETINTQAKSLEDIATLFPELDVEIKEPSKPFGPQDFLFNEGLFWTISEVFQQLNKMQPGELLAPVVDFQGLNYVLELTEMIEPEANAFEKDWAEKKENLLANIRQRAQYARQSDYMKYISDKAQHDGKVMRYDNVIKDTLGLNDKPSPETPAEEELSAEGDATDMGTAADDESVTETIDDGTEAPAEENADQ